MVKNAVKPPVIDSDTMQLFMARILAGLRALDTKALTTQALHIIERCSSTDLMQYSDEPPINVENKQDPAVIAHTLFELCHGGVKPEPFLMLEQLLTPVFLSCVNEFAALTSTNGQTRFEALNTFSTLLLILEPYVRFEWDALTCVESIVIDAAPLTQRMEQWQKNIQLQQQRPCVTLETFLATGLFEKYLQYGNFLPQTIWLTDMDLERALEILEVPQHTVMISSKDNAGLASFLGEHIQQTPIMSQSTRHILLNLGQMTTGGSHWIHVEIKVDKRESPVQIHVHGYDSLSLNTADKKFHTMSSLIGPALGLQRYQNQKEYVIVDTLQHLGQQKDGHSCGHRALKRVVSKLLDEGVINADNPLAQPIKNANGSTLVQVTQNLLLRHYKIDAQKYSQCMHYQSQLPAFETLLSKNAHYQLNNVHLNPLAGMRAILYKNAPVLRRKFPKLTVSGLSAQAVIERWLYLAYKKAQRNQGDLSELKTYLSKADAPMRAAAIKALHTHYQHLIRHQGSTEPQKQAHIAQFMALSHQYAPNESQKWKAQLAKTHWKTIQARMLRDVLVYRDHWWQRWYVSSDRKAVVNQLLPALRNSSFDAKALLAAIEKAKLTILHEDKAHHRRLSLVSKGRLFRLLVQAEQKIVALSDVPSLDAHLQEQITELKTINKEAFVSSDKESYKAIFQRLIPPKNERTKPLSAAYFDMKEQHVNRLMPLASTFFCPPKPKPIDSIPENKQELL